MAHRPNNYSVYLRSSEKDKLDSLVAALGLSRSGVFRMLLRQAQVVKEVVEPLAPVALRRPTAKERAQHAAEARAFKVEQTRKAKWRKVHAEGLEDFVPHDCAANNCPT